MKRRVIQLVLLLLSGGAIVNVAVAWGCAQWFNDRVQVNRNIIDYHSRTFGGSGAGLWTVTQDARGAGVRLVVYESTDAESVLQDFVHFCLIGNADLAVKSGEAALANATEDDFHRFAIGRDNARMQAALKGAEILTPVRRVAQDLRERLIAESDSLITTEKIVLPNGIETVRIVDAGWPSTALSQTTIAKGANLAQLSWNRLMKPVWPGFAINTIFYAAILWVVFFVPGKLKRTLRRRRGLCPACAYPVGTSPVCTECGAKLPLPRSSVVIRSTAASRERG